MSNRTGEVEGEWEEVDEGERERPKKKYTSREKSERKSVRGGRKGEICLDGDGGSCSPNSTGGGQQPRAEQSRAVQYDTVQSSSRPSQYTRGTNREGGLQAFIMTRGRVPPCRPIL